MIATGLWAHALAWLLPWGATMPAHAPPPPPPTVEVPSDEVALSPRNANYEMTVSLDPTAHLLTGEQVLTWTNTSSHPTSELQYHLYYNAWRNDRTSWLRRGRDNGRSRDHVKDSEWAYSNVSKVELVTEAGDAIADLTASKTFISPDDGNEDDQTVLRVELPSEVGPGQTVRVRLEFTAKVPRTFARTGVRGDYFFLAQWFPKVGVLEDEGWNCHQFIQTEFFADFGVYDVSITTPTDWVVGATGRERERKDNGDGTTTHRYHQWDVHDFAWTTAPDFIVHEQRWEHERLPAVDMRLLLRPDHADMADRYFTATAAALKHYGEWWGGYPYEHITIVDPAHRSGTGGMEYPTLFTGGTHWLSPLTGQSPEGVTVHEAGHQFWYGLVANNEFEFAWLDEGFNTYSTTRTTQAAFGHRSLVERYFEGFIPIAFDDIPSADRTDGADRHRGFDSALKRDPQATLSYQTGPGGYRVNAYDKGALSLRTLENYLGWVTFQQVMSTYFARYRFGHPKPEDFFAVAEEVSGVDLKWFWRQAYLSTAVYDYAVGKVSAYRDGSARGYVDDASGTPALAAGGDDAQWRSVVVARRLGDGVFPVNVDIEFEDGSRVVERWDGEARWTRFSYRRDSKVSRVRVDPGRQLVLDINRTNNSWARRSKAGLAATKWSSKWMVWVQASMEAMAFFS